MILGMEERIYRVWNDSLISEKEGEPYLPHQLSLGREPVGDSLQLCFLDYGLHFDLSDSCRIAITYLSET